MVRLPPVFLSLVGLTLLSGCATWYHVQPGTLPPASVAIPLEQREAVWRRAVTVLIDQGYVPQVLNEAACYILAKRREDIDNDALAGTMALFSITPDGRVRLEISGAGLFHSAQQFITAIGQRQDKILKLIVNQSFDREAKP